MPVRITGGVRMMISLGYTFLISQRSMSMLLLSRFSGVRLCATHRRQPTRLPRPWNSPGKNTGVGCHFLLQYMNVQVKSLSRVRLLATPWTAAYQGSPSIGFSRQKYWSGVPLPSPKVEVLVHKYASFVWHNGEGNGNPLHYSCLENPVDGRAWWAAVHRVAQSWT